MIRTNGKQLFIVKKLQSNKYLMHKRCQNMHRWMMMFSNFVSLPEGSSRQSLLYLFVFLLINIWYWCRSKVFSLSHKRLNQWSVERLDWSLISTGRLVGWSVLSLKKLEKQRFKWTRRKHQVQPTFIDFPFFLHFFNIFLN